MIFKMKCTGHTQLKFLYIELVLLIVAVAVTGYNDTWRSLDSRPLPVWYDEAKFGIFLHWGVFSVPSFGGAWFWNRYEENHQSYVDFVKDTEGPRFSYQDYAQRFTAELYRPDDWADIFAKAGAQYVVLTSKHHEGYCMWDSRDVPTTWNWNVMDIGPKRDLLGDLAKAVKNLTSPYNPGHKIKFGVYHSMYEWYNLLFTKDRTNNFTTNQFPQLKTILELYDLVEKYEPEIIWSDGAPEGSSEYWGSRDFLAWLANNSTVKDTVVWNDRFGNDTGCKHGSFLTCADRYKPDHSTSTKWENCYTVAKSSWGYNRNASIADYYSVKELIETLVDTVSLNGNLLLNVGPASDGTIPAIFEDRLLGIGEWLKVNSKAIYSTRPWPTQQQDKNMSLYYTMDKRSSTVYAIVTKWPKGNILSLSAPVPNKQKTIVKLLGVKGNLKWEANEQGMTISFPALTPDLIPCQHAWVITLENLENAYGNARTSVGLESLS